MALLTNNSIAIEIQASLLNLTEQSNYYIDNTHKVGRPVCRNFTCNFSSLAVTQAHKGKFYTPVVVAR